VGRIFGPRTGARPFFLRRFASYLKQSAIKFRGEVSLEILLDSTQYVRDLLIGSGHDKPPDVMAENLLGPFSVDHSDSLNGRSVRFIDNRWRDVAYVTQGTVPKLSRMYETRGSGSSEVAMKEYAADLDQN
jgi:hypothetical protein